MADDEDSEQVLAGGVANAGRVTRIGGHVLRPANPHTPVIQGFLRAVRAAGFEGVPLPVGMAGDGRERLEFIPGDVPVPPYPDWVQTDAALASIAALLRRYHAAAATVGVPPGEWSSELADPAGPGPVVGHNDVCLENVVFRDGAAVALLDFDFAAPGRPIYDLTQFARMCVPVDSDTWAARLGWAPADRPARLRLVADAYGLDAAGRGELLTVMGESIERGGEFVRRHVEAGEPAFIEMWNFMGGAERFDGRRRWWAEEQSRFAAALA